ncbi:hypothetical protein TNIN_415171 [Trichonephila inaurata madagascariensis]|uniref:Uncharacterized protein n=1 Tax=Trichonephila inaurata madagascariensis TaxID=2747483 RepID=A0A8X6Y0T6_9ARAC|nr:hypothetical protein TNIN_357661 [Trichonephila inaurata madagascariensis]GFY63955.1 hypothetical protein TNIN_415171 [Trichonephila inaurata madagascariensis]
MRCTNQIHKLVSEICLKKTILRMPKRPILEDHNRPPAQQDKQKSLKVSSIAKKIYSASSSRDNSYKIECPSHFEACPLEKFYSQISLSS